MSKTDSFQVLIDSIQQLANKLSDGTISSEEMLRMQEETRKLYERTVILNYKVQEQHVYNKQNGDAFDDLDVVEKPEISTQKIKEPETTSEHEVEKPAKEENLSFDFTSPQIVMPTSDELEKEVEKEDDADEQPIESEKEENVSKETTTVVQMDNSPNPNEMIEDEVVMSFYEKFTEVHDNSLMSVLSNQKLESLKGAFGLNDRLQIINELFNGDHDEFNTIIEVLDNLDSNVKARVKLSEIAAQHQWEQDNILVEELVRKVERRYA